MKKTKLFLISIAALSLVSCMEPKKSSRLVEQGFWPPNAKVVKELGNGWYVFEIEGKKFLYRYYNLGNATTEVIAPWVECQCQINPEREN